MLRVPEILVALRVIDVPVVDRAAIQRLFGFRRRRAIQFMHELDGYLVTNDSGIIGSSDKEDDESYRYCIHLKLISQSGSNEPALRFALLQVPGIQDVVFDRRAGTFTCYVYAITPEASSSLLSTVQDAIDQNVAFPLTGAAVSPDLFGITLAITIFHDLRQQPDGPGYHRRPSSRRGTDLPRQPESWRSIDH